MNALTPLICSLVAVELLQKVDDRVNSITLVQNLGLFETYEQYVKFIRWNKNNLSFHDPNSFLLHPLKVGSDCGSRMGKHPGITLAASSVQQLLTPTTGVKDISWARN